jgi:hypothetical protein
MKVLLCDARAGLYWGKGGEWVQDAGAGMEFKTIEAAGQMARRCEPQDINVVLRYDDPPCEIKLNPAYCVRHPTLAGSSITPLPPRIATPIAGSLESNYQSGSAGVAESILVLRQM